MSKVRITYVRYPTVVERASIEVEAGPNTNLFDLADDLLVAGGLDWKEDVDGFVCENEMVDMIELVEDTND